MRRTDDGMSRLEASLHPDEVALVTKAIELARGIGGASAITIDAADALMRVVEAYLGGAHEARSDTAPVELVVHVSPSLVRQPDDAQAALPSSSSEGATAEARSETLCACLDDGTRIAPEALRRLGCDAAVVPVRIDDDGLPVAVGRKARLVRSWLRRALFVRDGGGCRFPGCEHRGWIDAHHVEHWIDGGETTLANLVSLCSAHHRLVHEGGFSVELRDGVAVFHDHERRRVPEVPDAPSLRVSWLDDWRASAETRFTDETLLSRWNGRSPDYRACVVAGLSRVVPRSA